MCREVWDCTATAETSQQLSQCAAVVTNTSQYVPHSSQSQQNAAMLKPPTFIHQASSTVPTSAVRQTDQDQAAAAGLLLAQLQQLVDSCRLPDPVSTQLMSLFSQQLHGIQYTHSPPLAQVHTDSVRTSTSGDTFEVHTSETHPVHSNSCVSPAVSAPAGQLSLPTWCGAYAYHQSDGTSSVDQSTAVTGHPRHVGEMHYLEHADQLSLLSHLNQLQRMYLESAGNALRNLYVLQQQGQVVPQASGAAVDSTRDQLSSNSTTAGTLEQPVHSQASDSIPRSN